MDTRTEIPTTGEITTGPDLAVYCDMPPNSQCEADLSIADCGIKTNNAVLEGIWLG